MSHKAAKAERKAQRTKGFKIDLRPYKVRVMDVDETGRVKTIGGKPVWIEDDFDVRGSLTDIIFNPELKLKPKESFEAYDLAEKIEHAGDHVILDSKEMDMVKRAYDALTGVSKNMVNFLKRIRDAEEVQLAEIAETDD